MSRIKVKGKLTTAGISKIERFKQAVLLSSEKSLSSYMKRVIKPSIISKAPSASEERAILSSDVDGIGVGSDGRFLKTGGQRYVRTALSLEPVRIKKFGGVKVKQIWARYGNQKKLSRLIGFSWRVDQQLRSTANSTNAVSSLFWSNLINKWEEGAMYTVRSRGGNSYPLNPAPSVFKWTMTKRIPPFRMVQRGYFSKRNNMKAFVIKSIKNAARRVK